jgi:zinc and cadmium transporter
MQLQPDYIMLSGFLLASYSFLGLLVLAKKSFVLRLGTRLLIFTFGAFWGNILFHLLPETFERLPTFSAIGGLAVGWSISWALDKIITHNHKDTLSGIAYHLLANDALHNFMDGVIVVMSYGVGPMAGLATTFSVVLHELPQELCEWGVMIKAGFSPRKVFALNLIAGLAAPLGLSMGYLFFQQFQGWEVYFIPVVAGNFLFIANLKLLPLLLREPLPIFSLSNVLAFFSGILLIAGSFFFKFA